jgi:endonuclease YncB( thermonuclease family)
VTDFGPMPRDGNNHVHEARALSVHDGDTFTALVADDFGVRYEVSVRLLGVNCPELGTKAAPDPAGEAALRFSVAWLAADPAVKWPLVLRSAGWDRYGGRSDCVVWRKSDGRNLNRDLLDSGNAVEIPLRVAP